MTDLKPGVALLAKALATAAPVQEPARTLPLTIGGQEVLLTFGVWRALRNTVRHGFTIGDQVAVLDLPRETLDWLLAPLPCPENATQRGMLLELACLDLLDAITDVHATDAPTPPVAFGIKAATEAGILHLSLHLTQPLADALNDHLGRNAAPPEPRDMTQAAVPTRLQLGQQFLTSEETRALTTGDVIMLESGPALLLASDGFAAAVEMTAGGPIMQSDLLPLPYATRHQGHVRFEIAQAEMTLDALNALTAGQPLHLAVFADAAVDMLIEGRFVGRGQPVTIGTGAGIRITHLVGSAA